MGMKNVERKEIDGAMAAQKFWRAARLANKSGDRELLNNAMEKLVERAVARKQTGLAQRLSAKFGIGAGMAGHPLAEAAMSEMNFVTSI